MRCERARISGRGFDGRLARSADVVALLDPGAFVSVIGSELAARLGGATRRHGDQLSDGRKLPTMAVRVKVDAPGGEPRNKWIVVDDVLMRRARGKALLILGRDYLQRTRLACSAWPGLPGP
jgi:hypothetical protein